jgi:hypothetical protein
MSVLLFAFQHMLTALDRSMTDSIGLC